MKKVFSFLRSMRFGILLLVLIALCSVAGSVIPQGREIAWYAQTYQEAHGLILMLGLHRVFQSWYFITLLVLLCLNLSLCSLLRLRSLAGNRGREAALLAARPDEALVTAEGLEKLRVYLGILRCREEQVDGVSLFRKNDFGRWGTFLTHLAILLVVIFGAAALYLPQVSDQTCLPGQTLTLEDGTAITVDAFSIEDAEGKLDYASRIRVDLAGDRAHAEGTIRVNHPLSIGPYKIYQQTYGTAGSVTVTNQETGGSDTFTLTEMCFLSVDSVNGLWYEALYPGYLEAEDGSLTMITSTSGHYQNPVYQVLVAADGVYTPVLAFPGDALEVKGMEYAFNEPVEYPGLRIKYTPTWVNALLFASFALLLLALTVTFFLQPVLVKVDGDGYAVGGPKPEGMRIELQARFGEYRKEKET